MTQRYGEKLVAGALESPAAERNKQPILQVLERCLPPSGVVLEIATGTAQHVVHFARALPALTWQPTDADAELRAAASVRIADAGLVNVRPPLALDVLDDDWPIREAAAIVCINMIHIAPRAATPGLLRGAARALGVGAPLVLYGPFRRGGEHTAPSNAAFDQSLKARNPEWGVRNLEDVTDAARAHGFELDRVVAMPANNLTVVLVRSG